jgi:hypothetical protein
MRHPALIPAAVLAVACAWSLSACSGDDATLETLEQAKSAISLDGPATARTTSGNRIEVEGKATNHDKFQHDVFFTATLLDAGGKTVGTATGKLEDWPAGHSGIYKLVGNATPGSWTRVNVVVSNVTEHVRGRPE